MAKFKAVLLLFFVYSFSAQASIIAYIDRDAWLAALPVADIQIEDFEGSALSFTANSVDNPLGNLSVSLLGGVGDPGPSGLTGKGFFQTEVDASGDDQLSTNIAFDDAWGFALGGLQNDSLSSPSNLNLREIAISIGSESWVLSDVFGQDKSDIPFLGFVSDQAIDAFQFVHAKGVVPKTSGTSEEFYLDQLSLALLPSVVPGKSNQISATVAEPSIVFLFAIGLLGLGLKRRQSN